MEKKKTVLSVEHFSVSFTQYGKGFMREEVSAIRDLSLTVSAGELVAVVGSSGSGKSLLAHGIFGILPYNASVAGKVFYEDKLLTPKILNSLRGREIVLVPQSVSYLDSLMKIGPQVRKGKKDPKSRENSRNALSRYGLGAEIEHQYPFELSGGMARRVLISTAVAESPRLVVADEPTPGLHLEAAKRVLAHFREIAREGAGVLLITHDLELALTVADRVAVFYAGTTVEEAAAEDFKVEENLRHPYTRALFRAMPQHGFEFVAGAQPFGKEMPKGCPYGPRCALADARCEEEIPYREVRGGKVRCSKAR